MLADVVNNALHLRRIHKGTLHTGGLSALREQQIASTDQLVRTRRIENGTGIDHLHHTESHTRREVRFDDTGNDIGRGTLRSDNHVNTHGTRLLGDTGDRCFDLLACLHDQIAKLINDHHDERHELVSLLRIQMARDKLGIVFLDITHMRLHQQLIAIIHLLTYGIKCHDHLRAIGNHRLIRIGQLRQIVTLQFRIDTKLHHLGIHQDKLQFRRMLAIEQRGDNGVQSDRLTLSGSTSHQEVRHLAEIKHKNVVRNGLAQHHGQIIL